MRVSRILEVQRQWVHHHNLKINFGKSKIKIYTKSSWVNPNVGIRREDFVCIMVSRDVVTDLIANGESTCEATVAEPYYKRLTRSTWLSLTGWPLAQGCPSNSGGLFCNRVLKRKNPKPGAAHPGQLFSQSSPPQAVSDLLCAPDTPQPTRNSSTRT